MKVFVSSVSRNIRSLRDKVIEQLRTAGYDTVNMETFGARNDPPLDVCLRELRSAEVVVLIIGPHYGSIVPGSDISFTHAEYRDARRLGIPVLAFRIPDATGLDPSQIKGLSDFSTEAGASVTYKATTEVDLGADILASLLRGQAKGELFPLFAVFQPYERYFGQQLDAAKSPLFNHLAPFVGRDAELAKLKAFAASTEPVCSLGLQGHAGTVDRRTMRPLGVSGNGP